MSKRIAALDVLGEVRRALRILRRAERFMVQQERAEKRAGAKRRAAFVALQRASADDFGEQG